MRPEVYRIRRTDKGGYYRENLVGLRLSVKILIIDKKRMENNMFMDELRHLAFGKALKEANKFPKNIFLQFIASFL